MSLFDKNQRRKFIRYWVSDVLFGIANITTHFTLRFVPMSINSAIGKRIGILAGKTRFKKESELCRHNLSILKPEMSDKEVDEFLDIMWGNIGMTLCEYSILDKLWKKGCLTIDNTEIIDQCMANKEAIIFTGAHLGNWEAQASYCSDNNIPLMAVYKPVRNRFSKWVADQARERMNIYTVPTDKSTMKKMYKHLADKKALWLPIDDQKKGQVNFPRFGRPQELRGTNAAFITRLAQKFDAAIILVRTKRLESSVPKLHIRLEGPVYVKDESEVEAALIELDNKIESWVMEDLNQWFMLHELHL